MRAIIGVMLVGTVCLGGVLVWGQAPTTQPVPLTDKSLIDEAPALTEPQVSPIPDLAPSTEVGDSTDAESSAAEDVDGLRGRYLELIKQKSTLMDGETLREALGQAEKDIAELKADEQLRAARQILLNLVEDYPESKAAAQARQMMRVSRESKTTNRFSAQN